MTGWRAEEFSQILQLTLCFLHHVKITHFLSQVLKSSLTSSVSVNTPLIHIEKMHSNPNKFHQFFQFTSDNHAGFNRTYIYHSTVYPLVHISSKQP